MNGSFYWMLTVELNTHIYGGGFYFFDSITRIFLGCIIKTLQGKSSFIHDYSVVVMFGDFLS